MGSAKIHYVIIPMRSFGHMTKEGIGLAFKQTNPNRSSDPETSTYLVVRLSHRYTPDAHRLRCSYYLVPLLGGQRPCRQSGVTYVDTESVT